MFINAAFDIPIGSQVTIDETPLVIERFLGEGLIHFNNVKTGAPFQIEDPATGLRRMPDITDLSEFIREGRFRITHDEKGKRLAPPVRRKKGYADTEEITAKDPKASLRKYVVNELQKRGAPLSDLPIHRLLKEIFTPEVIEKHGKAPKAGTARKWLQKFGGEVVKLSTVVSRTGCVSRSRLDPIMRGFVDEGARYYYTDSGLKLVDAVAWVEKKRVEENTQRAEREKLDGTIRERQLMAVSSETVRRAILAIRCADMLTEKFGKEWVKKRFKVSGEPLRTVRMLQIGLIDDKLIDAVFSYDAKTLLPVGRPWLCILLDVHTRCVLGWYISFNSPSVHSATECIRRACMPKVIRPDRLERHPVLGFICGLIGTLIGDNGANYASTSYQDSLEDLGIAAQWAAVRSPEHKAMLERLFNSFKTMLTDKLPSKTMDIASMRDAGYNPSKQSLMTLTEFEQLVDEWVHFYHTTNHTGIGMQPARAWELSMRNHSINVLANPDDFNSLLGDRTTRQLTRNGIRFKGLVYRHTTHVGELLDDLIQFEPVKRSAKGPGAATVKVSYNSEDMGEIHVWNPVRNKYVPLLCTNQDYAAGLSLFQHERLQAWAKTNNKAFSTPSEQLLARAELNDLIRKAIPDVAERERRAMARMLGYAAVQERQGVLPEIATAPARFDGLAPVVTVEANANGRIDGNSLASRPDKRREKPLAKSPVPEVEIELNDDWDFETDVDGLEEGK